MARQKVPTYTYKKYGQLRKLKEGGTSTVWWAKQFDNNKPVALKILREDMRDNREVRSAFYREGSLMMSLEHKYVMRVTSVLSGKNPTLVMPYFPSENLKMIFVREPELVKKYRMKVAIEISQALIYVHEQNVVHKDLKPENILLDSRGEVRLIDFSLADQRKWYSRFNVFQRVKIQGTPSYLPPEQIRKDPVDFAADIYSLGVTFYEMFAGKLPFVGSSQDEILSKHLKMKPRSIKREAEELPDELCSLIMKMLQKSPNKRPKDMKEVLNVLLNIPGISEGASKDA